MSESKNISPNPVRFLFWNIHNNPENINRAVKFADEHSIHVIALCEAKCISDSSSFGAYYKVDYINQSDSHDIELFIKDKEVDAINYSVENRRYNLIYFSRWRLILAIAHFNSERTPDAKQYRQVDIGTMLSAIERLEKSANSKNTMIIGDLNFGLFDEQMLSFSGLNTRLFLSEMKESSRIHEEEKDCYYNPMLNKYNDTTSDDLAKGTCYFDGSPEKWCCYDHILMKESLIDKFESAELEIVSCMGSESLIEKHKPKSSISDHLPIYFVMNL